ncbi:DUF742 domain-containing protein [Streptomyces sp. M41(2017)]|uniref:DUF742 domain-containing protein n=1 Tax=Streptomyces sp. M41(2017) TaxID=1955065 RepID=UPI0015C41174|nr:DUF742 domain-containing protein [Streptomyces sp. M41(2017)]
MPSATTRPASASSRRRHSDTARPPRRLAEHHGVHRRATSALARPLYQVEFEALILTSSKDEAAPGQMSVIHQDIRRLCRTARSLAEVSALLELPLGSARLLVTVLAERGLVHIVRPETDSEGAARVGLVADVLAGLQRLGEVPPSNQRPAGEEDVKAGGASSVVPRSLV